MIGRFKLAGPMLLATLAGTLVSASSPKLQVPIGLNQVAAVLASAGVPVGPDQIEALNSIRATQTDPKLKFVSLVPMDGDLAKVRLKCESTRVCLPFYVLVHWRKPGEQKAASPAWPESLEPRTLQKKDILVQRGKNATMVFESKNVRMTLPVLCLQSGGRGQQVRVMSKDVRKIFVARVTGQGTVLAGEGD
jgi:hypothetical protein